jgi:hypothetical protein
MLFLFFFLGFSFGDFIIIFIAINLVFLIGRFYFVFVGLYVKSMLVLFLKIKDDNILLMNGLFHLFGLFGVALFIYFVFYLFVCFFLNVFIILLYVRLLFFFKKKE